MSIEEGSRYRDPFFVSFLQFIPSETLTLHFFYSLFKGKILTFCLEDSKALHIFVIRKMS